MKDLAIPMKVLAIPMPIYLITHVLAITHVFLFVCVGVCSLYPCALLAMPIHHTPHTPYTTYTSHLPPRSYLPSKYLESDLQTPLDEYIAITVAIPMTVPLSMPHLCRISTTHRGATCVPNIWVSGTDAAQMRHR